MTTIELRAGLLRATVSASGAKVASLRADGRELLAQAPWAESDRGGNRAEERSRRRWDTRYSGGWDLVTPNVDESFGALDHLPFHGEAAWSTWAIVESSDTGLSLGLALDSVPLRLERTFTVTDDVLRVGQTITNVSAGEQHFEWAEHVAWGSALLGSDTGLTVDDAHHDLVAWSAERPSGGFGSIRSGRGRYRLATPSAGLAVEVTFDPRVFPFLILWQEHRITSEAPWLGRLDALGVEPSASDFAGVPAEGREGIRLSAGQTLGTELSVRVESGGVPTGITTP